MQWRVSNAPLHYRRLYRMPLCAKRPRNGAFSCSSHLCGSLHQLPGGICRDLSACYAPPTLPNLRREAATPSRPRPSRATVVGSGTAAPGTTGSAVMSNTNRAFLFCGSTPAKFRVMLWSLNEKSDGSKLLNFGEFELIAKLEILSLKLLNTNV